MSGNPRRPRGPRCPKLNTLGGVVAELGRLYREARRGEVTVGDASKLATILAILRSALEAGALEARVAELERVIGGKK